MICIREDARGNAMPEPTVDIEYEKLRREYFAEPLVSNERLAEMKRILLCEIDGEACDYKNLYLASAIAMDLCSWEEALVLTEKWLSSIGHLIHPNWVLTKVKEWRIACNLRLGREGTVAELLPALEADYLADTMRDHGLDGLEEPMELDAPNAIAAAAMAIDVSQEIAKGILKLVHASNWTNNYPQLMAKLNRINSGCCGNPGI